MTPISTWKTTRCAAALKLHIWLPRCVGARRTSRGSLSTRRPCSTCTLIAHQPRLTPKVRLSGAPRSSQQCLSRGRHFVALPDRRQRSLDAVARPQRRARHASARGVAGARRNANNAAPRRFVDHALFVERRSASACRARNRLLSHSAPFLQAHTCAGANSNAGRHRWPATRREFRKFYVRGCRCAYALTKEHRRRLERAALITRHSSVAWVGGVVGRR